MVLGLIQFKLTAKHLGEAGLTPIAHDKGGTISRAWEWSPNGSGPGLSDGEAIQEVENQIVPGEGILVAVVEARYRPIIASFAIGNMTFRSVHTQVPLKKTIPLYR